MLAITTSASAQNLGKILKGVVTEYVDEATDGKATELLLVDAWSYDSPAVRFDSENELANLAGNALVGTVEGKLQSAYNLVGIKKGSCSLTLNADNTFSMVLGRRTLTGTYTYAADTHAIDLMFDTKLLKLSSLSGYAYIDGENLDVAFDCTKLVNFLSALGSKVSMLNSLTQLVDSYENVYLGFTFARS